jgi:RNA polymerase sigma-70 factor, ECF subfamily
VAIPRPSPLVGIEPFHRRPMPPPLSPAPVTALGSSVSTSASLLDLVRAADAQAWRRLIHLYSPLVFSWCRRTGLADEDAADVMQEVWRAVLRGIDGFDLGADRASFRGWLYTVTRNKARDFFRAAPPRAEGGSTAQHRLTELPEREEPPAEADETAELVRRALALIRGDFEERTFRAFWRTTVDEIPAGKVATELGLTVDAVYQARSRVLRRLREELDGLLPPGAT